MGGLASFDVFIDIEVTDTGETWLHDVPLRLEAVLTGLPPLDVQFEVPAVTPIPLEDEATGAPRGSLLYGLLHADPPFPPEGSDCFDVLFTADLHLFGPGTTSNLIGFGPARVARSATIPGGTCSEWMRI